MKASQIFGECVNDVKGWIDMLSFSSTREIKPVSEDHKARIKSVKESKNASTN